jgi:hypothetical protein
MRSMPSRTAKARALAALVGLVILVSSCNGDSVPWGDYAPSVKATVDSLEAAKDCAGLQEQFDTADANNAITQARTGHNNAALMSYIDHALRRSGCTR